MSLLCRKRWYFPDSGDYDGGMSLASKSPKAVLITAHEVARAALPPDRHACSPREFTQHQLFACLALKAMLKTN